VNLIRGKLPEVVQFLDELSGIEGASAERQAEHARWQQEMEQYRAFLDMFRKLDR
jgi:hypothetical protein